MTATICTNTIINLLSQERMVPYGGLDATNTQGHDTAIDYYIALQDISSHFFVILQLLEISLRNRMHTNLSDFFSQRDWYSTFPKTPTSQKIVSQTDRDIKKEFGSRLYSDNDFICRLSFGFWTHLLDKHHRSDKFWAVKINNVFTNRGAKNTGALFDELKKAGTLRNRLYHHEPIWKSKKNTPKNICFLDAVANMQTNYDQVAELLFLLSIENQNLLLKYSLKQRFLDCCLYYTEKFKNK